MIYPTKVWSVGSGETRTTNSFCHKKRDWLHRSKTVPVESEHEETKMEAKNGRKKDGKNKRGRQWDGESKESYIIRGFIAPIKKERHLFPKGSKTHRLAERLLLNTSFLRQGSPGQAGHVSGLQELAKAAGQLRSVPCALLVLVELFA